MHKGLFASGNACARVYQCEKTHLNGGWNHTLSRVHCVKWRKLAKHKLAIPSLLSCSYRKTSCSNLQVFWPFHHCGLWFWTVVQNRIFLPSFFFLAWYLITVTGKETKIWQLTLLFRIVSGNITVKVPRYPQFLQVFLLMVPTEYSDECHREICLFNQAIAMLLSTWISLSLLLQ